VLLNLDPLLSVIYHRPSKSSAHTCKFLSLLQEPHHLNLWSLLSLGPWCVDQVASWKPSPVICHKIQNLANFVMEINQCMDILKAQSNCYRSIALRHIDDHTFRYVTYGDFTCPPLFNSDIIDNNGNVGQFLIMIKSK